MRLNFEHPPLAKALAALPLVLRGVHADYSHLSWTFSGTSYNSMLGEWSFGHWLITRWNEPRSTMAWARAPMLLLTLALGFVIYWCGARLGDVRGGFLCLALYISTPAFLTFGPLVITDIAVALFSMSAMWTFASMWSSPSRAQVAKFGVALAAALLSKFSAGLLLISCVAFALSLRWVPAASAPPARTEARAWRGRGWRGFWKGTLLAASIVYAVYFLLTWNQASDPFGGLARFPAFLHKPLLPPLLYVEGVLAVVFGSARPTYILGQFYPHGVWFFSRCSSC